jgi:hypothetical protein
VACQQARYRSGEGQYCSTNSDEDPHYECLRTHDFVCISTFAIPILFDGGQAEHQFRDVFLCRLACSPSDSCPAAGDVCCPGMIHGRDYGKSHACVPEERCETIPPRDGGVRPMADAATDRGSDADPLSPEAGAGETGVGVPAEPRTDAAAQDASAEAAVDAP